MIWIALILWVLGMVPTYEALNAAENAESRIIASTVLWPVVVLWPASVVVLLVVAAWTPRRPHA